MKLDYEKIPAVEIKGFWDTTGVFVATDIEELPKPRRPKLRGEIQAINLEGKTIMMYGIRIKIDRDTQFQDTGEKKFSLEKLSPGQRVEISCKVDTNGQWEARKVKVKGIKKSNKVKGNITRAAVDGTPPDTLEIQGLLIILTRETDLNKPTGFYDRTERELFGELSSSNAGSHSGGITVGPRLLFNADYRQTVRSEIEYDLSESILSDHKETEPEIRLELAGYWNERYRTFAQLRMRKRVFL